MANKPKFYPNLPRVKSKKKFFDNRVLAVFIDTPVRVPRVIKADRTFRPSGVVTPNYLNINTTVLYGTDIRSGIKNPNWRVTIAKGGDATSAYSRTHFAVKPTAYSIFSEDLSWSSRGFGTLTGASLVQENNTDSIDAMALGRLKNRLSGKVGNAKLLAPIAESREIGRLVRQINGLGMSAFKSLLAAKKTWGKSAFKEAGSIWLGLGFGVNPLLKDIQHAADSILHYVTRTDNRVVTRGTATQEYHSGLKHTSSSEFISSHCTIAHQSSARHMQGIRYVAGVDLEVRAGANYGVTNHLGLELGQLPSMLWELTAFSWAFDYFTTVGEWLDDVFYTLPGTVVYLSKSYKYQCDTIGTPVVFTIAGAKASFSGTPFRLRYTKFARTKLAPTLPTRPLRIRSLDEVAKNGTTKLLNLASVLIGRSSPRGWKPN
jgi:hypothetical protein